MASVITKCRQTGHYTFLTLDIDPVMFERSGGPFACTHCPFCETDHSWFVEDSKVSSGSRSRRSGVRQAG